MQSSKQRNYLNIAIHILSWLLFFFLPDILFDMPHGRTAETKRLVNFGLAFIFFYLNYFLFVPYLLLKKRQLSFAVVITLSLVFSYSISNYVFLKTHPKTVSSAIENNNIPEKNIESQKHLKRIEHRRTGENVGTVIIVLLSFLLSTITRETGEWYRKEEEKKLLEKEKLISELSFLKSQVNPHFLFNSLNGIYALAIKKSGETPTAILQLSDLLRHMLYDAEVEEIGLGKEANYLKNYIALQKLRLPADADVKFEVYGNLSDYIVAPLLFIPFVENAFKHGAGIDNIMIHVKLSAENNEIFFSVVNKYSDNIRKDKASGIGLKNVEKRLSLLYPEHYILEISNNEGLYKVLLKINLNGK